jgi:hypothetical protein
MSWPASHAATLPRPADVTARQAAGELLRRRAARGRVLEFVRYTKPDYQVGWHHALLCRHLDRFAAGATPNLIVCVPPQHGKSELVSRRLPALLLGQDPDARIIACSYGSSLASDMNRDVQRVMDDGPYRRLFPGTRLSEGNVRSASGAAQRNSDTFEVVGRAGFYRGAGVGGPITGKPMDYGIIDDPFKNREEADSPAVREAVWKWYTGAFLSRAHKDTRKLVCHTRWHPDDLVGRLLKRQEEDPNADRWEVLSLPAVAEESRHRGDPRNPGEAMWPERHPLGSLLARKAASLTDWFSLYQQHPRAEGAFEWPDELFGGPGFWFDRWPDRCAIKAMALDPSKGSESRSSDYQACIVYGRTADGTEWVEADMGKRPMVALRAPDGTALGEGMVERCLELYALHAPEGLAVETNVFQQLLLIPFRHLAPQYKVDGQLRLYQIDNRVNKNVRIRRLGDPLSRRRMRFRNTPGTRLLVEQLKAFPCGDHDDGPDALEMARRTAIEIWNGRAK